MRSVASQCGTVCWLSELLSESILIYDTSKVSDSKGHLLKQLDFPGVVAGLRFRRQATGNKDKQIKSFTSIGRLSLLPEKPS